MGRTGRFGPHFTRPKLQCAHHQRGHALFQAAGFGAPRVGQVVVLDARADLIQTRLGFAWMTMGVVRDIPSPHLPSGDLGRRRETRSLSQKLTRAWQCAWQLRSLRLFVPTKPISSMNASQIPLHDLRQADPCPKGKVDKGMQAPLKSLSVATMSNLQSRRPSSLVRNTQQAMQTLCLSRRHHLPVSWEFARSEKT